jgi:hypothetical protein
MTWSCAINKGEVSLLLAYSGRRFSSEDHFRRDVERNLRLAEAAYNSTKGNGARKLTFDLSDARIGIVKHTVSNNLDSFAIDIELQSDMPPAEALAAILLVCDKPGLIRLKAPRDWFLLKGLAFIMIMGFFAILAGLYIVDFHHSR